MKNCKILWGNFFKIAEKNINEEYKQELREQTLLCFWMRSISIIKCQFLKENYLNAVLRLDPYSMWGMEMEEDKNILRVYMEEKMSPITNKKWLRRALKGFPLSSSKIQCNTLIIQKAIISYNCCFWTHVSMSGRVIYSKADFLPHPSCAPVYRWRTKHLIGELGRRNGTHLGSAHCPLPLLATSHPIYYFSLNDYVLTK